MTRDKAIAELVRIWNSPHLDLSLKAGLAEAIETLKEKNQSDSLVTDSSDDCKESESKLDLISRQAAIEAIEQRYCDIERVKKRPVTKGEQAIFLDMRAEIKALPSAEAVQRWIPVSERLPDTDDCSVDCMVTRKSKFVGNYVDMAVAEKNGTWTHEDWNAIVIDGKAKCISTRDADIIAWMPLPEPYKGGEDEWLL